MARIITFLLSFVTCCVGLATPAMAAVAPTPFQEVITHDYGLSPNNWNPGTFFFMAPTFGVIKEETFSDTFTYAIPTGTLITSFDVLINFAATNLSMFFGNPEDWYVTPGGLAPDKQYLLNDSDTPFTTQKFTFTTSELGSLFSGLADGSFTLAFTETRDARDNFWGLGLLYDYFWLDSATVTVYGQTAATPLPGAVLLLGSGLLGLVGVRQWQRR